MNSPPHKSRPATRPGPAEPDIITFGCRLNAFESQVMRDHARAAGLENAVIINTCAVTREAVRQARQAIRRARATHPGARLIVTGCAAQIDPDSFAAMNEVDEVWGNEDKLSAATYTAPRARSAGEKVRVCDIMEVRTTAPHLIDGFEGRARAFVQIQNGCDHRCTFCVIPYSRGPARSVPAGRVIDQIRTLVAHGYPEVVLTGVDLTSYGSDLPERPTLGRLVNQILRRVPDLPRLRLSSLDAVEVDESLFRLITREERLMPHLHLSLQSGDDLILKRMKRRHSREDAVAFCAKLHDARPDIALGADLIAGFPTESEEMFANTLRLIDDCALAWVHVFPYSAHARTPAARMPQVPGPVIKDRARRLRARAREALGRHLIRHIGRTARVLMEKPDHGRLDDFTPVAVSGTTARGGEVISVHLTAVADNHLIGVAA